MLNEEKRLIDCSLKELGEFIDKRIESKQVEDPVTTEVLCQKRNIHPSTLTYYKGLGLQSAGYNRWYLSEYDKWINEKYSKITTPRKKKTK